MIGSHLFVRRVCLGNARVRMRFVVVLVSLGKITKKQGRGMASVVEYGELVNARISTLAKQHEEITGKRVLVLWLPSKRNGRGVYFFNDGTMLTKPDDALKYLETLMRVSSIWVRER